MCLTISYHAEKAAAGVVIFLVLLQMAGELVYLLGEKGDLDLR